PPLPRGEADPRLHRPFLPRPPRQRPAPARHRDGLLPRRLDRRLRRVRSPRRDHPHRAGRLTKVERLNEKGATVTLLRKRSCLPVGWRRSTMPRASCWAVLVVSWTTAPTAFAPARYGGDCVGMTRPDGAP